MMRGLLIADKDMDSRKRMAELLIEAGYNVTVTNSAADALYGILKQTAQVVLLSGEFDDLTAVDLIPLMKRCNRNLTIILVADEVPLQQIRRVRREGIFYHALRPVGTDDREEIRQAVQCAFDTMMTGQDMKKAG